jgi:hypothetical protein
VKGCSCSMLGGGMMYVGMARHAPTDLACLWLLWRTYMTKHCEKSLEIEEKGLARFWSLCYTIARDIEARESSISTTYADC